MYEFDFFFHLGILITMVSLKRITFAVYVAIVTQHYGRPEVPRLARTIKNIILYYYNNKIKLIYCVVIIIIKILIIIKMFYILYLLLMVSGYKNVMLGILYTVAGIRFIFFFVN